MNARTITAHVAISDQPTEDDLRAMKDAGYVGIVNLRHDGEPEQPLSTAAEGEQVRAAGLDYLHYGVGGAPVGSSRVDLQACKLEYSIVSPK